MGATPSLTEWLSPETRDFDLEGFFKSQCNIIKVKPFY